jgi:diacylglycerol kinase family enzyme
MQPAVGDSCLEVPIDAIRVSITLKNGITHTKIAASHVMIGGWLRGRLICLSNGGFIGPRNVSPRAHPNDGFVDVMSLDSSMDLRQRLRARHKSILGTHTPHPLVEAGRVRSMELSSLSRTEALRIDGRRIRRWTSVQIEIVPDYWRLLV